ncbi:hypothetical protein F5X99DRAFT_410160 [Biscogniauxia marginata]|nr:hypothetical protein F5X99DRAFT_410160 [Biscogniauxia marginata]
MRLGTIITILSGAISVSPAPSFPSTIKVSNVSSQGEHTTANMPFQPPNKALGGLICEQIDHRGWANRYRIDDGIAYLHDRGTGLCGVGPGPRACRRVSCSYYSAIWACNDEPVQVAIPWALLSQYAQYIQSNCYNDTNIVAGQIFDDGQNYNVVIGADDC